MFQFDAELGCRVSFMLVIFLASILSALCLMSVRKMAAGQENYYTQLARQDYYTQGGEKPGYWYGAGARQLGLGQAVRHEHLAAIMRGYAPDGTPLGRLQANRQHQPGYDVTFSAPKPASALWAVAPMEISKVVEWCHQEGVRAGLGYLQDHAIIARRGQGGAIRESAGMVAAIFEHGTSRNLDPQLHTHVLIANAGLCPDGSFRALDGKPILEHQLAAGAVYRSTLAACLQEKLGVKIRPDGEFFKIDGIPDVLVERFSSRRQEILEYLSQKGIAYSSAAAEIAALETRSVKGHVARELLFSAWARIGEEYGFGPRQAAALVHPVEALTPAVKQSAQTQAQAVKIVAAAAEKLGEQCGSFTERSLVREAAVKAQHRGMGAKPILEQIAKEQEPGGNLLEFKPGDDDGASQGREQEQRAERAEHAEQADDARQRQGAQHGEHEGTGAQRESTRHRDREPRWTTRASSKLMERLEKSARSLLRNKAHHLREDWVERFAERRHSLSAEQKQALLHITTGTGALGCVDGLAGTGKTTLLRAAKDLWTEAGYQVLGCAPTGRAARELEDGSGIPSRTIASMLWRMDPSLGRVLAHEAEQIRRAILGKRAYSMDTENLTSKTVLVMDEASMTGAKDFDRVLHLANRAKAKVVVVGDLRQFEAITLPGAFDFLVEKFGAARLTDVKRQYEPWYRDAVMQIASGDLLGALTQFSLAGKLHVCPAYGGAERELIASWQDRRTQDLSKTLIIARTRKAVGELNARAQAIRHANDELGGMLKQRLPGTWVYRNDRVILGKNSKRDDYVNGDMGTVEKIGLDTLTIRLDRTERKWGVQQPVRLTLDRSHYKHIRLGYAVTAYKAQGITVERAFVATEINALEPLYSDELRAAYVQLSRAREETQVFVNMCDAGEEMAQQMEQARQQQEQARQQRY